MLDFQKLPLNQAAPKLLNIQDHSETDEDQESEEVCKPKHMSFQFDGGDSVSDSDDGLLNQSDDSQKPKVPMLDFSVLGNKNEHKAPPPQAKGPGLGLGLGLNLQKLKNEDFQDEFMANLDNFSKSWRDAA